MAGDASPSLDFAAARVDRRAHSRSSTCSGSRSRSPARTCAAWPRCGRRPRHPDRRRRDDPHLRELLAALEADAFDVYQSRRRPRRGHAADAAAARGAALARDRWFTPHTWTNGIGLLANLHVAAGVGGGPFIEFPYDPPGWTPERRDAFLAEPMRPDADGVLRVPRGAGHRGSGWTRRRSAVRGMSATLPSRDAGQATAGSRARPRSLRGPSVHRRAVRAGRVRARRSTDIAGRDGSLIARRRGGRGRGRGSRGHGGPGGRSTTGAGRTARRPTANACCSASPS